MWHIFYTSLFTRTIQSKYNSYELFLIDFLLWDHMQLLVSCHVIHDMRNVTWNRPWLCPFHILFCSSFIQLLSYFHPNSIFSRCFQLFYLGWQYFIQPGGINTRLLLYSLQGPWDQSRHNFKSSNPQQFAHSPPSTVAPLRHGVILIPRHTLHIR